MGYHSVPAKRSFHVVYFKTWVLLHQVVSASPGRLGSPEAVFESLYRRMIESALRIIVVCCCHTGKHLKLHFFHSLHTGHQVLRVFEKLIGIKLSLSPCCDFMHQCLGIKHRKIVIHSKPNSEFLHSTVDLLLEAEKPGKCRALFDGRFRGMLWCCEHLFLKLFSGRNITMS